MTGLRDNYDIILFDVGDTLLIRQPSNWQVLIERCQAIGLSLEPTIAREAWKQAEVWWGEQILREINGAPRMPDVEFDRNLHLAALRIVWPDQSQAERLSLTTRLQTVPKPSQAWQLVNGVGQTLAGLLEMGLTLGVVSNFDETLPELCDQFNLTPYFKTIVVSSLVGVEKPDPEILLIACRRLRAAPSKVLYVGDHPFDVLCAKEAGVAVAWLSEPEDRLPEEIPYRADYRIGSIDDLLRI